MKFYTMIFIDRVYETGAYNGISGEFEKQINTYISCAKNFALSLNHYGYKLSIITNEGDYIKSLTDTIEVIQIPFDLVIPKGILFYSAHHKIDVFKWLGGNGDDYSFLVDNDMMCINEMPVNLKYCIKRNFPVYYDISDSEYAAYGRDKIISSKYKLDKNSGTGLCAGGEFVGGDRSFFMSLHSEIMNIIDVYFSDFNSFVHQSDEMVLSVVLEKFIREKSYPLINAGLFGGIGRYWSSETRHCQHLIESYYDNFLLHIPKDKEFIANYSFEHSDQSFISLYKKYLISQNINIKPLIFFKKSNSTFSKMKRLVKTILKHFIK